MRFIILTSFIWLVSAINPSYAEIKVVASIKPVHSLVSAVMEGVGKPYLIVKSSGSPHTYNMKPSDARAIQQADLVFWIGEKLETFLKRSLKNLSKNEKNIQLFRTENLTVLKYRNKKEWLGHKHRKHDHHDHGSGAYDMHIWLSPENAIVMVKHIAARLIKADPKNAARYESNRNRTLEKLTLLSGSIQKQLSALGNRPFIVFHDSFQYLEKSAGLNAAGSITLSPEEQLGARHLSRLQKYIKKHKINCLFSEPQFNFRMVNIIAKNLKTRTAILDPIGANFTDGPDLYFQMMEGNAKAFASCLKD